MANTRAPQISTRRLAVDRTCPPPQGTTPDQKPPATGAGAPHGDHPRGLSPFTGPAAPGGERYGSTVKRIFGQDALSRQMRP
jgi:hypothetical protein